MIQTILLLDFLGFIGRRFLRTKLHIRLKNVFLSVLLIQYTVALIKTIVKYIKTIRRNSMKKPLTNENQDKSNHPYLRVVK